MATFKINITNNSTNTKVTTGTNPLQSAIVTKEV